MADFRKDPKGKVPFIEEDGKLLGDSQLIIEHLKRKHGDTLDAKLSTERLATGHLVRRVLEESTYWHIVYVRWADAEGWRVYRPYFDAMFPPVVGKAVVTMIRRSVVKGLRTQGLEHHTPEEIFGLGSRRKMGCRLKVRLERRGRGGPPLHSCTRLRPCVAALVPAAAATTEDDLRSQ